MGRPIALRKGIRSCRTNVKHPIGHYLRYEKLGNQYKSFLTLLGDIVISNWVVAALQDPRWKAAMDEEMTALEKNNTWDITMLPKRKIAIVFPLGGKTEGQISS